MKRGWIRVGAKVFGEAVNLTILLLFIFVIFVIMVGTKDDDAIVLYYDAVVDTQPADENTELSGDVPAAPVSITVNGEVINKAESAPESATGAEDLREVVRAKDPVSVHQEAQNIFDMIHREGL